MVNKLKSINLSDLGINDIAKKRKISFVNKEREPFAEAEIFDYEKSTYSPPSMSNKFLKYTTLFKIIVRF